MREGYPCARVNLASRLKLALVYKQVTLSPGSTLPALLTCLVMRDILCKGLFTRRESYPRAKVTLASELKMVRVYKQISQVRLPYHPSQLYQLY